MYYNWYSCCFHFSRHPSIISLFTVWFYSLSLSFSLTFCSCDNKMYRRVHCSVCEVVISVVARSWCVVQPKRVFDLRAAVAIFYMLLRSEAHSDLWRAKWAATEIAPERHLLLLHDNNHSRTSDNILQTFAITSIRLNNVFWFFFFLFFAHSIDRFCRFACAHASDNLYFYFFFSLVLWSVIRERYAMILRRCVWSSHFNSLLLAFIACARLIKWH